MNVKPSTFDRSEFVIGARFVCVTESRNEFQHNHAGEVYSVHSTFRKRDIIDSIWLYSEEDETVTFWTASAILDSKRNIFTRISDVAEEDLFLLRLSN